MKQQDFIWRCRMCPAITVVTQKSNWTYAYPDKKFMCILAHNCKGNIIQKYNMKSGVPNLVLKDMEYLDDKEFIAYLEKIAKEEEGQ